MSEYLFAAVQSFISLALDESFLSSILESRRFKNNWSQACALGAGVASSTTKVHADFPSDFSQIFG